MPSLADIPEFPDPPVGHFWRVRPASTPGWAYLELRRLRPFFSKHVRTELVTGNSIFGLKSEFVCEANKILKSVDTKESPADYIGDYYA